jgi:N-dimethylarginine dimethylaminohydrolase
MPHSVLRAPTCTPHLPQPNPAPCAPRPRACSPPPFTLKQDETTLLVSDDAAGHAVATAVLGQLPELAARLRIAVVPADPLAANVLALGRDVVMQAAPPPAEAALRALCTARGLRLHVLPRMSEIGKADGALTCCSILLA